MAAAKRKLVHPPPTPRDVAALVRARGRIVSNVSVARWMESHKAMLDGYDASQAANKYVQDHPKGLAKGEKHSGGHRRCATPRKPRAKKKPAAKKAKKARANPTPRRRKSGSRKSVRRSPRPKRSKRTGRFTRR